MTRMKKLLDVKLSKNIIVQHFQRLGEGPEPFLLSRVRGRKRRCRRRRLDLRGLVLVLWLVPAAKMVFDGIFFEVLGRRAAAVRLVLGLGRDR